MTEATRVPPAKLVTVAIPKSQAAIHRDGETADVDALLKHYEGVWKYAKDIPPAYPAMAKRRLESRFAEDGVDDKSRWTELSASVAYDEEADVVWFRIMFEYTTNVATSVDVRLTGN